MPGFGNRAIRTFPCSNRNVFELRDSTKDAVVVANFGGAAFRATDIERITNTKAISTTHRAPKREVVNSTKRVKQPSTPIVHRFTHDSRSFPNPYARQNIAVPSSGSRIASIDS